MCKGQEIQEIDSVIRHLSSIIWPPWVDREEAILLMLTLAFDASGDEGTAYVTVAGFASSTKDWDEFSKKWKERLDRDGVEFFRAVDANNFRGPFEHWRQFPDGDRERLRQSLFMDLMYLIDSHTYQKFSCSVVNEDYRATDNQLRQQFSESAYSYAARACEAHARKWATTEWKHCTKTRIGCVFEAGDGGQNEAKMRERLSRDYGHIPPTFRPKKDTDRGDGVIVPGFIPLQAADWLAWEVNRAFKDAREHGITDEREMRWPMQRFFSRPSPYMSYVSSEELGKMDELLSAIDKVMPLSDFISLIKARNAKK